MFGDQASRMYSRRARAGETPSWSTGQGEGSAVAEYGGCKAP